jgi:Zn-dependent peptidase ImmA (M78 family)
MLPRTDRPEEEALAAEIRHRLRLGYGHIDPFAVAKQLGLEVVRYPVGSAAGVEGQYAPVVDGVGAIFVNSATSVLRQRFTAAHEIGHFVLHRDRPAVDTDLFSAARSPIERQADRFAGALLIDETGALEIWERAITSDAAICELVDVFEVSIPTAAIQLQHLALISQLDVDAFLARRVAHGEFMRSNGRQTRHRNGDSITEVDADFRANIIEMLAAGQIPAERAAQMLGCTIDDLPADALDAAVALIGAEPDLGTTAE